MTSPLKTLELAVWTPGEKLVLPLLTRFILPIDAQRILVDRTRSATNRGADPTYPLLEGLSEILAWFVPEVSFMRIDRVRDQWDAGPRLMLFFLGDRSKDSEIAARLRAGLATWTHIAYAELPASDHKVVVDAPLDRANWNVAPVPTRLSRAGTCPVPEDPQLFEMFVSHAINVLRNAPVILGERERVLVPRVRRKTAIGGLELVVFPPIAAERDQLWSEVVTLTAATFPERDGIHVIARASLRNWGPVGHPAYSGDPKRSLDVFMPRDDGQGVSHVTFDFRAQREEGKTAPLHGIWCHHEQRRVFDLLQRLTGNTRLSDQEVTTPYCEGDLWILPRLAPGSGDRYLAGGSGVGWKDRASIADALERTLSDAGFVQADRMTRVARQRAPASFFPFTKLTENEAQRQTARRAAVLRATQAVGNADNTIELLVLHVRESTPHEVRKHVVAYLGAPNSERDMLEWADGLRIRLVAAPADVFAEALPKVDVTDVERARFTQAQIRSVLADRRTQAEALVEERMTNYVRGFRKYPSEVGCVIVEMADGLMKDPRRDPYTLGRHCLARECLLPQVILDDGADDDSSKHSAAVRDVLLRMLGVVPLPEVQLAPGALTILQANQAFQGGKRRNAVALPVAARVNRGLLECALPDKSADPEWIPYANAVLRVLRGEFHEFERGRDMENRQRYERFFGRVLEEIDQRGPALVLVESSKIRHKVTAFQNGKLRYDALQLGTRTLTPTEVPGLRIIRMSSESDKQPFCFHRQDTAWPSGVFRWGDQKRTGYSMKKKPQTVKKLHRRSRHAADVSKTERRSPRVHPSLDEVCVMFQPSGDDAMATVALFHKLREAHAQYDSATRVPFPLHELQLLARGFSPHRVDDHDEEE